MQLTHHDDCAGLKSMTDLMSSATLVIPPAIAVALLITLLRPLGHSEQGTAVTVCANRTTTMAVTAEENFMIVK
jgi:hypothetical protein